MRKHLSQLTFALLFAAAVSAAPATGVVNGRVSFQTRRGQHPLPAETILWLQPAPGTKVPKAQKMPRVYMTTRGKMLLPHVLPITVGTTVQFPNEDPISHNLFSLAAANSFDLGLYRKGAGKEHTFTAPGMVNVYCNVHPNMSSVIQVLDTPYFGMADQNGTVSLKDVVPGKYSLIAWNEQAGSAETQIDVLADGTVRGSTDVTIDARSSRPTAAHANKYGQPYPTRARDY